MQAAGTLYSICTLALLFYSNYGFSQDGSIDRQVSKSALPIPKEQHQLFYLQRDPDSNTVIYALNIENGQLNTNKPVKAYWIRYAENQERKSLSLLQERMAYGVQVKPSEEGYTLHIRAYNALTIYLVKVEGTHSLIAEVKVNSERIKLDHLFVRIKGGSFFHPNIDYIEIVGKTQEGATVTHQLKF